MDNSTAPIDHAATNPQNHAAYLWITSILCLSYSLFALAARFYAKRNSLGVEDILMGAAQIIAIAQYIAFFFAVANGLGKDAGILTPHQNTVWSDSLSASQILLLLSHALTKCSVILLIRRLFARNYGIFRTMSNVTLGLCMLWGVASAIAIVAGCSSEHLLAGTPSSICPHDSLRWKGVTITDVITESLLILLPLIYVAFTRLRLSQKLLVITAFLFRLPGIVLVITFYITYAHAVNIDHKEGISIVLPIIFQQIVLFSSLVSATAPCMKSCLRISEMETPSQQSPASTVIEGSRWKESQHIQRMSHQLANLKHGLGFGLESLSTAIRKNSNSSSSAALDEVKLYVRTRNRSKNGFSSKSRRGIRTSLEFDKLKIRPEPVKSTTTVYASETSDSEEIGKDEDGIHKLVIRRNIEWEVQFEGAS